MCVQQLDLHHLHKIEGKHYQGIVPCVHATSQTHLPPCKLLFQRAQIIYGYVLLQGCFLQHKVHCLSNHSVIDVEVSSTAYIVFFFRSFCQQCVAAEYLKVVGKRQVCNCCCIVLLPSIGHGVQADPCQRRSQQPEVQPGM